MLYLSISNSPKLYPLLDLNIEGVNIDLHNDYSCNKIEKKDSNIEFSFHRLNKSSLLSENFAKIAFSSVLESNLENLQIKDELGDLSTLVNFSKEI